jgi:hypothetical protein
MRPRKDSVWQAPIFFGDALPSRTGRTANPFLLALNQRQEDLIRFTDGQRGIDAVVKGLHRFAR